ncbi:MAG: hypothetical protein GX751_04505 [Desulfuromonadaceae bacterium]|nr:hypothetical protein [Desulfuromonadaceae bacterium]
MKKFVWACFLILTADFSFGAALILQNQNEVVENYFLEAKKSEKLYFYPFGRETIRTQIRDINGDRKDDILVTEQNHCDRDTGCFWRIYLNLGKETDGPYCLSAEIDEEYLVENYSCLADGWVTALNPSK